MINRDIGSAFAVDGKDYILTTAGANGHAVFGPYDELDPGDYVVEFTIALADGHPFEDDAVCAIVDVSADHGRADLAADFVLLSQLRDGEARIPLAFHLHDRRTIEYRVRVNGMTPLRIAEQRTLFAAADRPTAAVSPARPVLLSEQRGLLKHIFEEGGQIRIVDHSLIVTLDGVAFHARIYDDINFVDEIFFKSTYNFSLKNDACVIDVGMNVGLASLIFAGREQVREVHAFEPFAATYARGLANLALNPALSAKIRPNNIGLGDKDEEATLLIHDNNGDSGGMATRNVEGGTPMEISIRDAASTLRPIIAAARAKGRDVIAKIDCEGAEFAIFGSLASAGLFGEISALMVEWHRVFEGRTQAELIRPLLASGFVVFDLTPKSGNGFFYAVRAG